MLGISIYPEKASIKELKQYLDLAYKYHFQRVFTCLLSAPQDLEQIKSDFKEIISYARNYNMEVILDINPDVLQALNISYDDLSFFHELNASGIRLDLGFDGKIEALMTNNPYNLKIELNMSHNTSYVNNICDYQPNKNNLIGCHNFYPQKYTGLSLDYFIACNKRYKALNLHTACFVSSNVATMGPWPITQGLPTLEMHRDLAIDTQVKHLYQLGLIDDIIVANQFASEAELAAISSLVPNILVFKIHLTKELNEIEKAIVFNTEHKYRGDMNDYLIRTSESRIKYGKETIAVVKHDPVIKRGSVVIGNQDFGQYQAELQIVKQDIIDEENKRNVIGYIDESELFLLDLLKPWQRFDFKEDNEN